MIKNIYSPIIKLGEAETKAVKNVEQFVANKLTPIVEITRGRGVSRGEGENKHTEYPHEKRLSDVMKKFENTTVFLDATSDYDLSNEIINEYYNPCDGYRNWVNFVISQSRKNRIIPSVLFNFDDTDFEKNIVKEIKLLKDKFGSILYRCFVLDDGLMEDCRLISKNIGENKLYVVLDCEYIQQAQGVEYVEFVDKILTKLNDIFANKNVSYIVSATSYPNNISEIGLDAYDVFSLCEVKLYNDLRKRGWDVEYSDYASISVKRNDKTKMAHGWVPRIDVPTKEDFYYYRKRRDKQLGYGAAYTAVAKLVKNDIKFPSTLKNNWGIEQILETSEGDVAGASPNFWISVRMNIHLQQQLERMLHLT